MREAVLNAVVEPAGHDIVYLLLFQTVQYVLGEEAAVHADQSDPLVPEP